MPPPNLFAGGAAPPQGAPIAAPAVPLPPGGPSPAVSAPPPPGAGNMIGGPPRGPQMPAAPPSLPQLTEALHKTSYVASMLSGLLSKPDLSAKDILDDVGEMVAEQVMSPFMAAKYLSDLPPDGDSLKLRQWVGQHYATTSQSLQTVAEMISAHGQMMRGQAPGAPAQPSVAAPVASPSPAQPPMMAQPQT
jgi:hypothetical protein